MLPRLLAALLSLAKNAVPALCVWLRGWAAPNAMLLYLGENIALVLLVALTVRLMGPREEVIEGRLKSRGDALRTFFLVAAPFTFGAAILTAAVLAMRSELPLDVRELAIGLGMMLAFQLAGFATGLRRLRGVSLAACEEMLVGVLGRVFLLAFAVWAGLLLALFVSSAFVLPFILLKTIVDVWTLRVSAVRLRSTSRSFR
jgi:hypothetical protein